MRYFLLSLEMSFKNKCKSHRRTVSAGEACSASSQNENTALDNELPPEQILSYHCSPKTKHFIQGLSSTWSGKPPKVPQPEQTLNIFTIVMNALREIIDLVKRDHSSLKLAADSSSVSSHSQGKLYEVEKQIKAAERYCKELEFHLFKLEELKEKYEVQQKMRDGIRSMAYAYILSHGKSRESALHNVHSGYKECNNLLYSYETKLQLMMGTFSFEMIGIQGFARMCHGDVFEIIIKHSDQKWKSRGHVLKNDKQSWENKKVMFKSYFSEPLYIKAVEIRGLGKNVVLGNKYCETRDLFSAHPQQMTINLNPSGSLKLNLIITWNPVSGVSDETNIPTRPSLFGSQSLLLCDSETNSLTYTQGISNSISSSSQVYNNKKEPIVCLRNASGMRSDVSTGSGMCKDSLLQESQPVISERKNFSLTLQPCNSSINFHVLGSRNSQDPMYINNLSSQNLNCQCSQLWSSVQSGNSSECNSIEMASSSEFSGSTSSRLRERLSSLLLNLENVREQYPDLDALYEKVTEIERFLKFQRPSVLGSDVSISIKSALGCFDFLNTAVDGDDFDYSNERLADEKYVKTPGSEKSYITEDIDNFERCDSLGASPIPLTSGIEQLDLAIIIHSEYSSKLTEKLCSGTPLKYFEISSLEKLRKQLFCFSTLLKIIKENRKNERNVTCGSFFTEEEDSLKQFWIQLLESDSITTNIEQFLPALERTLYLFLSEEQSHIISRVARRLILKILDEVTITTESIVTVGHFHLFFMQWDSIESSIQRMASEENVLQKLKTKDLLEVKQALEMLLIVPFNEALYEVCLFLIDEDQAIKHVAENFFKEVSQNPATKKQIITGLLKGLEFDESRFRRSSCAALHLLEAYDCSEQLTYLSLSDENLEVRKEAENAIQTFRLTDMRL